jgi:deazaflavin-dependent oxidoreductase (nitroreductase family)
MLQYARIIAWVKPTPADIRPADRWLGRVLSNRRLTRLPVALYRLGCGFLLGSRLVMIEHVGRSSNLRRFVVVECIERFDSVVRVASGFGRRAQWYRNVAANEIAYISTGHLNRVPATPRLLTKAESDIHLRRYAEHHPQAWRRLEAALRAATGGEPEILIADFTLRMKAA